MDEKVLKLLERAIAENLSNERVSYIMGVNGYDQSAIDSALGELKKKRPSQEPASQPASAPTASTASPIVPKPERTPSGLRGSEPTLPQFFQEQYGAKPAELPIPQKPGPQIEYVEDKKGNVVARDRRTGEVTYSDTPSLSPEARKNIQERVLSGQVQTAPVQVPTSEVTAADWFGDKWNGLIEGLETFASNVRDEHSSNGQAIADFIEDKKQDKPELYQLYEKSLSDSKERGYSDEFARGLAANAAYTQFYQKDRSIENEILPYIRQKGRDVAIDKFGVEIDEKVQKELKDRFFSGAVRGLSSSLPAMAASASTMGMSFFDMAYNGAEEQLAIQLNENPELQMSKAEQETYKITVAGIEGILEKVGLGNTLKGNPMLKRALAGKVLTRLAGLGEDAGAEAFEKIVKEEARGLGGYVRKVAAGAMSEFETGALQQLSNDLINQYVTDSQGQNVFQPKTAKEIIKDVLYAGAQEAVGGGIISGTIGAFQKPGLDMTKEEFDNGINFAQNIKVERVNEFLNEQVAAGQITEEQAASTLNRVQEFKDAAAKIPEELTDDAKYQIFQLIAQKQGLQKNAAGKDEAIQERVKQKVDAINQQIQEVYDSQTQQSVSGTVQEGEIIGQVFQPGTSTEKTSPSGVLQAPQAEVDIQFYAPAFTVDPLGRAVVSPEKDNSVVSSIGNVRPTQEVTEDDASELNRVFNVAKNAVPEGTKVVVHNSLESLLNSNPKAAQLYVDGKGTAKAYWNSTSNEFHVLSRGAVEQYNAATGGDISYAKQYVHEVVHPILNTLINEDAEVQSRLFTEIESMAKGGNAVAQRAMNFGRKYAEKKQQNETVTEFFALMAQPDALKSFDKNFKQRIKDFFNELFVRLGMDIKLDTDQDLYTMARNIDLATRTGTAIVFPKTNAAYQARSIQASLDSTPAGSRLFNEPLAGVEEIVQEYVTKNNIPYRKGKRIFTIDKERAKAIGQAYDVMRHEPSNPEVKRSYEALAKETLAQHQLILENGYEVEINNEEPYNNSAEMIADLRDNKRMRIFSTESGFGDEPITDDQRAENPMLRDSGYRDVNGNVLLVNDVFRFVHDFFGHAERGNSFGPVGEENAWDAHSRMYTNLARKAMTSETRGQNSWVNFSGVNEEAFKLRDKARKLRADGRTDEASKLVSQVYEMMRFAEQKNGLLPDAFVANDYDELEFSMDEKTVDIRDGAASVRFVNANKTFVKQREIVYAERVLEKNPMFMFTGTEKIESAEDVAYLFRHLESAVSENAFVTFSNPKNGEFRVQWLGTGGTTSQVIDTKQILAAYQNFAEDLGTTELSVTLVHNHPSGTLAASEDDVKMLDRLRKSFELTDAKIEDGVIINLDSGKFVTFNKVAKDYSGIRSSKVTTQEIPYDVFSFNRQVLYTPSSELTKITSLNDAGQFLSKFKRGRHEKLGYFVMNQQNKITYAAIMDPNKTVADAARELSSDVGRYGEAVIIFGTDKTRVGALKDKASSSLSSFNANILDAVVITDSEEYLEFESSKYGGTSTFQKSGITGEIDFSLDNPIDFDKPFPVFMPSQKIEDALFAINPNHNPEITPTELFELANSDKSYKNQIYTLAAAKAMRNNVAEDSNDWNILSKIVFGSEWDGRKQKTQDPFRYHKDTPFLYHFTSARNLSSILGHQPKFELLGRSLKGNRLVNDEFAGEIFINPRKAASQYQEYEKALADYDNKSRDFVRKVLSIENVNPLLELFGLNVDELSKYANRKIDSIATDARGASGLESLSGEKIGKQPRAYDYIKYFSSIDEVKSRLTDEILEEYDVEEGKDGIVLLSPKTQSYGFNIFENLSTTSLPFFNVRGFSTMKGTGLQGYNGRTVYFSDSNSRIVLKKPSELNKLGIKTEPGSDDNGTYAGEYEAVLYPKDYDDANYIGAVEQVEIFGDVRRSEYEAIKNAQAVLGFNLIESDVNVVNDDADISFSLEEEFSVSDNVNIMASPKADSNVGDLSFSIDDKVKRHKGRGKTANGKLEDFVGRKMHVTFSDRMVGGFVDGEEYLGGVYFPAITNSVWGANSVGAANKIVKAAVKNPDGYRYVVVAMMNPDSHMSNKNMSAKALKEIERELSSSRVTVEEGYDRIMKAFSKKDLNERFGPIVESYKAKRQTKGNLIKLIEETVMADATFDLRRSFLETVLGKADKNLKLRFGNLPSYGTLAQMLAEPVTRGMEVGDTSFIIRTKGDLSVATPDPKDPDYHPSYKNVVRSTEDVELVFIDQVYNVVDMFPRIEAKNLGHEEYKNAYGKNWRTRYLMYMGLGKMSTTVSDELVVPEQQIEFSVDEASNLRQTISRTVNRFNPETRARIMANPDSYYTKQSLKAIKGNLENMSDDELLENMTAEGLNTVSRTAAVGKGENDISVLAAVELINRKVANGEDVSELVVDLAQLGTTVGRMLRHFAELKSSSPLGIVETVRAALKRADRVMTATQEQKLTSIAERFIAAQQKVKALRDQIELVFDSATESELNNATKELDKVTRELNAFTSVIIPKKVMDLLSTTIQGNLLTPMSQVTNVGANMVQIVTSIPVKGFETLFSKITSVFTGRQPRSFSASVMALPYAIKQAGVGTLEALQIIIRGGASTDKIVHSGFMPAASLLAALSDTKFASMVNSTFGKEVIKSDVLPRLANGNIAAADRAKALYEGLLGAAPEVMFRFLSLGDKPFFRFAEAMQLAQEANRLGLKGEARRNFLKYPTKKAMSTAEKAGKVLTFQQDNQAANIIFQLQKSIGSVPIIGKMLEFMFKVSLPYVKTPANIFSETMKFALPAYGVATATDKFFKKDYEGGSSDLAKAAVGQMILAAANYLIVNGIITAAFDDEDEGERAMMYLKQPPSSINKDALARLLNGESPEYKDGDRFARYDKLGIPGMVLGARANAVKRAGGKVNEEGLYVGEESMFKPMQAIWDQISMPVSTLQFMNEQSFLSGTNSLLNVLSGEASERDVEKWLENTFRSLTAIPFPNTLSAVHRGYREYMPNITTDNISNKFRYVVQDRMFDTDGVPVRVTPLGEKIPQTPEGANKFMYNLIDFTKSMKSSSDKVWGELYSVYKATEEPDVAPKFPTKLTRLPSETPGGDKIKGWNADVEREWRLEMQRIQEIHGKGKMELLENLFQSNSYNQADNEQRAKMIVDLYNDYNRGQRTIKSPFGRMPSLKPRFEWKLEYEKVEQKFLD